MALHVLAWFSVSMLFSVHEYQNVLLLKKKKCNLSY